MKLFNTIRCLFLATMLTLSATTMFAQNVTVKGKVTDSRGEPVIGATVMLSGNQTVGALTDMDGNYSINVPSNSSLIFSCVGYATQTIAVDGRTTINIAFEEDTEFLDETVVIGYGTQRKRLLTGATINITGDDILKQSTTNALGAIYSSVPGVNIVQSSGGPGAGYNITVRGIGTTGTSSPLVVIDGVASSMNSLNALNPADIESIDILKDAASAAIYGARAANGVVLVTTRQGKIGDKKATVTFDAYTGFQQPNTNGVHAVSASEYLDLVKRAGLNEFDNIEQLMPVQMEWIRKGLWDGTDWFTASINKNAPTNNLAVGVTGGGDAVRYSFSFSKSYQEGTLGAPKPTYYDRTTVRANTDFTVLKKNNRDVIKLGENVTFSITDSRDMGTQGRGSDVSNLLTKTPLLPAYDLDGSLYTYEKQVRDGWDARDNETNLLESQTLKESQGKSVRVQGNVYLEVSPIRELRLRTAFGFRASTSFSRSYTPEYQLTASDFKDYDSVSQSSSVSTNWTWELTANYKKTFAGDHTFEALAGTSIEATGWGMSVNGTRSSTKFGTWNSANLGSVEGALTSDEHASMGGGNTVPYNDLLSFFGRLNYSYKDKYLFTAIVRTDGSCNFAKGNRWGVFPSVSAGWVISEEPWMASTKDWLSFFKVRGSWGQNGNCSISNFQYTGTISLGGQYDFSYDQTNPVTAAYPDKIPNSKLSWETSEQTAIGFDSRFFRSRLGVVFDWYRKDTKDWLVTPPSMGILGASAASINGGAVRNSGVELSFTWNDNIGDLRYSVGLNGSYNKNNVLYINNADGMIHGEKKIISENVAKEDGFRAEPGKPIGYFLGIASEGIFQNQAQIDEYNAKGYAFMNGYDSAQPGDVIWIDQNGDGVYDENDCIEIGNPHPDVTMGFNLSLQWKGFDFSVNGSGAFGQQVMQSYRQFALQDLQGFTNNLVSRYWTGEGSTNKFPRYSSGSHNNFKCNSYNSDIFIQDADYVKIRNITFGYDLKSAFKRLPFQMLRIFVTGQNLFTFTGYDGMDPEVGSGAAGYSWSSGIDTGFYPSPKVYMAGVSIKF
ncbi:MAG: TonB-dependent receptor [Bacteroidales bacterium]|nr:TonB-dependent receptor [Bacteroidales bacterium]MBR5054749.1 TonB-dependent receptor [Bacteroidales bacterium]